jgi:hypothetical protein
MNTTSSALLTLHDEPFESFAPCVSRDTWAHNLDNMLHAKHIRATDEHPLDYLSEKRLVDRGLTLSQQPSHLTSFSTDPTMILRTSHSQPELFKPRLSAIAEEAEPGIMT